MSVRPIRLLGDPVLTTRASEVEPSQLPGLRTQVQDMFETMEEAGGVGLAANQIGSLARVLVFDTRGIDGSGMRGHLINPRWKKLNDVLSTATEGCLSIPGVSAEVTRPETIVASGIDVDGRAVSIVASGLTGRCLQHEIDHLDGILYLDHLEKEQRKEVMAVIRSSDWFN